MGRRKIEIRYIEDITKREATYSNRRSGILKKANDITILCNAQVFLIMFPKSGKIAGYISPSTTYQKKTKIDLSASDQYEVGDEDLLKTLQNELKKQKEINSTLRKEIRQRTGQEDFSEFSYGELLLLEEDLRQSLEIFRFEEAHRRHHAKRERKGSHLNALNAVPSQVTFQLQPSQPNLSFVMQKEENTSIQTDCSSTLSTK
ncbi:hypothetical protein MKW98_031107 [Papaver atlanticum]|uniref:MADS-box domain-containing protein n=1 Tax=Papaver atlanticum TaxID=357466 RepID=A0AAD4SWT1_9MAGN|nr:hypothetical protein MKW98_031107 [Papaver atlanticum]